MEGLKKVIYVAIACCCLNGMLYAQSISLKMSNVTVKQAIDALKEQCGYSFIFSSQDLDTSRKVSVSVEGRDIREAIRQIIEGQSVTFEIKEKDIIIRKITQQKGLTGKIKTVTGTVLDPTGEPVIGANVVIQGTTEGTITDLDGKFSLEVPEDGILQISYIGFNTQNVAVKGKNSFSVKLSEDSEMLDEVVVVGYGSSTKRDLIASVSTVKTEQMSNLPVTNIAKLT